MAVDFFVVERFAVGFFVVERFGALVFLLDVVLDARAGDDVFAVEPRPVRDAVRFAADATRSAILGALSLMAFPICGARLAT
ncbi:MAG TPA: hypothetical protein VFA08_06025 [Actinomycetota bacterium]|nr:hypothetical protein [Actinomycetota bacterium]